jgi:hypothetical protein
LDDIRDARGDDGDDEIPLFEYLQVFGYSG